MFSSTIECPRRNRSSDTKPNTLVWSRSTTPSCARWASTLWKRICLSKMERYVTIRIGWRVPCSSWDRACLKDASKHGKAASLDSCCGEEHPHEVEVCQGASSRRRSLDHRTR